MNKEERKKYDQKIQLYEKLGAVKFQKVVFKVEALKFKILKKICPNFIKYFDKFTDFRLKRSLKKANSEKERKIMIEKSKFTKMAARKEFYQEKNSNYHIDLKRPTEMLRYLELNKSIHKDGLKVNAAIIALSIIAAAAGFSWAIPILIYEFISAGINFECVNIQNYNICRYKKVEDGLKKREEKRIARNVQEYGQAAEVIKKSIEASESVPSIDEIINNVQNPEQLRQLKALIAQELIDRNLEKSRGNKKWVH